MSHAPVNDGEEAGTRIRVARGPRATEAALLDDLRRLLAGHRPRPLARPVLIVVPSRSLRAHLVARLARSLGGAILGLTVRTHHHVAIDLLDRERTALPFHTGVAALLARRRAAQEPALARALAPLRDGFHAIATSVGDLRAAGLEPAHLEALAEALAADGGSAVSGDELERCLAGVRVAARVGEELERLGLADTAELMRRATTVVRADGDGRHRPAALLVHGFADATGVTTDFLEALLDRYDGTLYLDRPPDPAEREETDAGVVFSERFAERFVALADERAVAEEPEAPRLAMFRAAGADGEIREVAERIRALLESGAEAEGIAIVSRRLEPYRTALRRQLADLGIPFSAGAALGPLTPEGSRLRALRDLLRLGDALPVERWLEIQEGLAAGVVRHLLRHALLALGAGYLGDLATLRFEPVLVNGRYKLPVRQGFDAAEEEPEGDAAEHRTFLRRSWVSGARLERARAAAGASLARLEAVNGAAPVAAGRAAFEALVREDLAWPAGPARRRALEVAAAALDGLGPDFGLEGGELAELLGPAFERAGRHPFGGDGGGVQILDVTEARALTFDHLFVVGLNRGVFPRVVVEDPLLPDALREVLGRRGFGVLPDLPRKLGGHDEERFLFSQLLAAAPTVTLSWQEVDEEGAQHTPSPLVERIRWSATGEQAAAWQAPPMAPHLHSPRDGEALRTAREAVVAAAIHGERAGLASLLAEAFVEGGRERETATRLAATRLRILDEYDPLPYTADGAATRARLGPYFGFVGAAGPGDPRADSDLWVTRLEGIASCPWQMFVQKVLRVEPPADPLEVLPGIDGMFVGNLVHRVLEALVRDGIGGSAGDLEAAAGRLPFGPPWPGKAPLRALVRKQAERLVLEQGIAMPGFGRALTEVALPYLEVARRLDWEPAPPPSVAVEVEDALPLAPRPGTAARQLRFRADRADLCGSDLVLTDYKTGRRSIGQGKLLAEVGQGRWLQAVAYALARGRDGDSGRYAFLNPALDESGGERKVVARADDPELVAAFHQVVDAALEVWERGLLFPRLIEPERDREPMLCRLCDAREACLRGDSGARGRLFDWAAAGARGELGGGEEPWLDAWKRGWRLAAKPAKGSAKEKPR